MYELQDRLSVQVAEKEEDELENFEFVLVPVAAGRLALVFIPR